MCVQDSGSAFMSSLTSSPSQEHNSPRTPRPENLLRLHSLYVLNNNILTKPWLLHGSHDFLLFIKNNFGKLVPLTETIHYHPPLTQRFDQIQCQTTLMNWRNRWAKPPQCLKIIEKTTPCYFHLSAFIRVKKLWGEGVLAIVANSNFWCRHLLWYCIDMDMYMYICTTTILADVPLFS